MAPSEFGTGKSIIVLAIVVGCFAILWPKIFYPMMQTAFSITSPKPDTSEDVSYSRNERPPHLHPGLANPRVREPAPETTHADKVHMREGRPFPHPSARQPVKPQPKSGGAMSIIMPVYTIGIVVFFLYTVLKLVFKKSPDTDKKPLIKDFHMDPEYRKFVCQEPLEVHSRNLSRERRTNQKKRLERREPQIPEETTEETFDEKDYEIYQLRKRLEETEAAMERIMKHMGAVSECLSSGVLPKDIQASVNANKISNQEGVLKTKKRHLINELQNSAIGTFEIISNSTSTLQGKGSFIKNDKSCADVCICTSNSGKQLKRLHKQTLHCDCTGLVTCEPLRDDESHLSEKIPVEGIEKLERESSINSEASSYEVLSQSQGSSSGGHISASPSGSDGSDNKDADNEASENSADNPSFEALSLEKLSAGEINRDESFEGVLLSESEDLPKESSLPNESCVTEITSSVEKLIPNQNEKVFEENDM